MVPGEAELHVVTRKTTRQRDQDPGARRRSQPWLTNALPAEPGLLHALPQSVRVASERGWKGAIAQPWCSRAHVPDAPAGVTPRGSGGGIHQRLIDRPKGHAP